MPCNSDHFKPTGDEIRLSKIHCLLDELDGSPINKDYWEGYHPKAYGAGSRVNGNITAQLCARLQNKDISKYSLEMQLWWRDHQAQDKEQAIQKSRGERKEAIRQAALRKLTSEEKKALGLEK